MYRLRNLNARENTDRAALAGDLLASPLFDEEMTHGHFADVLAHGWRIKSTKLSTTFDWPHFIEQYGSNTVLMFDIEEKGALRVASAKRELEPKPGWTVIGLVPPTSTYERSPGSSPGQALWANAFRLRDEEHSRTGCAPTGFRAYAAEACWNCASSVDPVNAVVDDWPCWIAWVTASK